VEHFLIYWVVPTIIASDPNVSNGLLYGFWLFSTMIFTGSSIAGSMLSYLISYPRSFSKI